MNWPETAGCCRQPEHHRIGAIGDARDQDPIAGLARLQCRREHQPWMCGAGLTDCKCQSIADFGWIEFERARELLGCARIRRVKNHPGELARLGAGPFQDGRNGLLKQWRVGLCQCEPLFP